MQIFLFVYFGKTRERKYNAIAIRISTLWLFEGTFSRPATNRRLKQV